MADAFALMVIGKRTYLARHAGGPNDTFVGASEEEVHRALVYGVLCLNSGAHDDAIRSTLRGMRRMN